MFIDEVDVVHRQLHSFPTRRSSDLFQKSRPLLSNRFHSPSSTTSMLTRFMASVTLRTPSSNAYCNLPVAPLCQRSEEHTSELQSHVNLVCRLPHEKKKQSKCY